jgi:hypothetical protein
MVTIYGASDDILTVIGDGLDDEFSPSTDDDTTYQLALSDGSVFTVKYDGCWRISQVVKGEGKVTREPADETDPEGSRPGGEPWYSDIITVDATIKWALGGTDFTSKQRSRAR